MKLLHANEVDAAILDAKSGIARGLRRALRLVVREGTIYMANEANENRRPQPWWAKLLEKVGQASRF